MGRLSNNILTFSQEQGVDVNLYAKFKDYVNHYRAVQFKANVDFDNTKSFEEKNAKMHEDIEQEVLKISGMKNYKFTNTILKSNPVYKWAVDAIITSLIESIIPDVVIQDFQQFAEIQYGGYGDTFTYDIDSSDLFILSKISNGKRHAFGQRQFKNQETLIPEARAITVETDLYRILSGKRNLAEYALKVVLSFEEQLQLDIYNAINDTYSSLGANFKAAAFTQAGFVQLAERVSAANGGAAVTAFGTKTALSYVLPDNDNLKLGLGTEYSKIGYIRDFMNVDMMQLNQKVEWKSGDYEFRLDNTRLYFISTNVNKLVKIAIEGDMMTFTDTTEKQANLYETQTMQKRWAVGLVTNAKYGIMDVA